MGWSDPLCRVFPMRLTRAAMYVDFDNFFGGLMAADPEAAVQVATDRFGLADGTDTRVVKR